MESQGSWLYCFSMRSCWIFRGHLGFVACRQMCLGLYLGSPSCAPLWCSGLKGVDGHPEFVGTSIWGCAGSQHHYCEHGAEQSLLAAKCIWRAGKAQASLSHVGRWGWHLLFQHSNRKRDAARHPTRVSLHGMCCGPTNSALHACPLGIPKMREQ